MNDKVVPIRKTDIDLVGWEDGNCRIEVHTAAGREWFRVEMPNAVIDKVLSADFRVVAFVTCQMAKKKGLKVACINR